MHELKTQLNANSRDKIKDAVKKTIAAMTVGKVLVCFASRKFVHISSLRQDVSALFTDVVKSMQTGSFDLNTFGVAMLHLFSQVISS